MEEFGAAMRDEWRPLIEADGSARLLWCWELTHGTGASYQAITVTAVRDWAAWGVLVARMQEVRAGANGAAAPARCARTRRGSCCCRLRGRRSRPSTWPRRPDREQALFLHDTGWPFPGRLDDYVAALGSVYLPQILQSRMISLEACWITAPGTGRHHEAILLQKILDWPRFTELLARGEQGRSVAAGWWRACATATAGSRSCCARRRGRRAEQGSPDRLALAARESVERFLESSRDPAGRPVADRTAVELDHRHDLGARAGEEALVGDEEVVAPEPRLARLDAGLGGERQHARRA